MMKYFTRKSFRNDKMQKERRNKKRIRARICAINYRRCRCMQFHLMQKMRKQSIYFPERNVANKTSYNQTLQLKADNASKLMEEGKLF